MGYGHANIKAIETHFTWNSIIMMLWLPSSSQPTMDWIPWLHFHLWMRKRKISVVVKDSSTEVERARADGTVYRQYIWSTPALLFTVLYSKITLDLLSIYLSIWSSFLLNIQLLDVVNLDLFYTIPPIPLAIRVYLVQGSNKAAPCNSCSNSNKAAISIPISHYHLHSHEE